MRILLAVDGSIHSRRAVELLRQTAAGRRHQVTVFNVTPPVLPPAEKGLASITRALKESALAMTASYEKDLRRGRAFQAGAAVAESRDPADAILERARKEKSDLIVLGARGLKPFKAFFLGSVSQKVLSRASAPVLIVRNGRGPRPLKVLAGVDGSLSSHRALRFLSGLGLAPRARVVLLHAVVDPLAGWLAGPYGVAPEATIPLVTDKRTLADLRRRGRRILEDARKALGRRATTVLEEGFPADTILRAAKARSADLVVVGRRGLSRLDRFFLGSVSQKVASYAGCSVLVDRR